MTKYAKYSKYMNLKKVSIIKSTIKNITNLG